MKYTLTNIDKTKIEIAFEATPDEYETATERAYERTKGKYNIQGFRNGKVPRRVIERNYGEGVFFEDAFADVADMAFQTAFSEHPEIRPYGDPDLELTNFVDKKISGKIITLVLPEPKLGKYTGLTVSAILNEFDPAMVDEELKHAQTHHTHSHPVEGKVSENGDIAVIDFEGSIDGVPFEGGKATDYELELGSHSFIDTFEDQLIGHKAGDHITVNVTFPENYGAPALAGKKAVFECDMKSVNAKHIPEINDELAKHVAGIDTLEEWKKDVEAQIRHELDHRNETIKEDAIIAQVIDNSEIELPAKYIEEQLDMLMRDLTHRLAYQGMRIEDYANYVGKTVADLREERREDAVRIAKTKSVLEAIVRAENIDVTDAEIDEQIADMANASGKTVAEYKKNIDERQIRYIESDILMRKLMKFLTENNTVVASKDGEGEPKKAVKKTATKSASTAKSKTAENKEKPATKTTKTATKTATKSAPKATTKTASKTTTKATTAKTATKSTATKKTTK